MHEQEKSHQNCDEEARERDKQAKGKAGCFVGTTRLEAGMQRPHKLRYEHRGYGPSHAKWRDGGVRRRV